MRYSITLIKKIFFDHRFEPDKRRAVLRQTEGLTFIPLRHYFRLSANIGADLRIKETSDTPPTITEVGFRLRDEALQERLRSETDLPRGGEDGAKFIVAPTPESLTKLFETADRICAEHVTSLEDLAQKEREAGEERRRERAEAESRMPELKAARRIIQGFMDKTKDADSKTRTEAERTVKERLGQEAYRAAQMALWGGRCAVTGIGIPQLLRASHAKPWAECATDEERLDPLNGMLLSSALDALFDGFLISFDDAGKIMIAEDLPREELTRVGITSDMRLRQVFTDMLPYLHFHRERFRLEMSERRNERRERLALAATDDDAILTPQRLQGETPLLDGLDLG